MHLQGTRLPWLDTFPCKLSNNNMLWVLSWAVSNNMVILSAPSCCIFSHLFWKKPQNFKSLQNSSYLLSFLTQMGSLFALSNQSKSQQQRGYNIFVSLLMKQNSPFAIQSCIFRNCFFILTMHPWPLLVQPSQLWQLLFKSLHSKKLFSNFSVLPETALNRHKGAEKMKLPSTGFFYWVNSAVIDFTDLFKNLINFTSPS